MKAKYTSPAIKVVEANVETSIWAASDTRIGIDGNVEIKDGKQFHSNRYPVWDVDELEEEL